MGGDARVHGHERFGLGRAGRRIPRGKLRALVGRQPVEIADRRVGTRERIAQQRDETVGEPRDRIGLEQVERIDECRVERAVRRRFDRERQVEFGRRRAGRQQRGRRGAERRQRAALAVRGHHLEQRMMARAARHAERVDDLLERHVLMHLRVDECALRARDQRREIAMGRHVDVDRERVDEKTDQPGRLRPFAIRGRHADADPRLAGRAREQRVECGEQHRERRRSRRGRERAQLRADLRIE
ncbi:L-ornithine 5-monooxygenase domain protein [Burkholderia multivorans]|nr:L-ornithine 5-monooxygenase domain protein [Burkholderia multivorans]